MNIFDTSLSNEHLFMYVKCIISYIKINSMNNFYNLFYTILELKNKILICCHKLLETSLYYNFYLKQFFQTSF